MHFELAVGVLDVARHGVRRDPEPLGDLGIGAATCQQTHNVGFAQGEHVGA